MKRFIWSTLFICLVSSAVFAQKAKLPSKIGDGFVLEFAAPYNRITIDTSEKNLPNREFSEILITPQTKIQNQKGKPVAPETIRAGMKIEVRLDPTNFAQLTALQIKLRTNPDNWEVQVDGYLDRVEDQYAFVDGAKVVLPPNTALVGEGQIFVSLKDIPPGSLLDLKGVRQANGSVVIKQGTVKPNVFTPHEMQLVEKLKQGLTVPPPGELGAGVKIGERTFKVVEDLKVNTMVIKVGDRVVPKYLRNLSPEDPNKIVFRFYVLEDETPNAVAFADGSVFVHTGLLKRLENEAQLAIVLGHEIAHVTNEHVRRRAEAAGNQALLAAIIGAAAGKALGQEAGESITKLGYVLMSNKFSGDMEDQADRVGLYYAYQAGYDVREAPKIWRRLMGNYNETTVGNVLYADHPAMLARLRDMRREVVFNYAAADFSEMITGREKFVEGVGVYFGWIQPKPKTRVVPPITPNKINKKSPTVKPKAKSVKPQTSTVKKPAKTTISLTNFRNFTYESIDGEKRTLRLGKYKNRNGSESSVGKPLYVDFNDDGVEEAFVVIASSRPAAGAYWTGDFYIFEYRNGKAIQIFHQGLYKYSEIKLVGKKIFTVAPFWRDQDAHCCPFATEEAIYEWKNNGIVRTSQNFKPIE
ncbi:MAG: M48 family metallopeptidase [Pyrinomonadaceae bacterium]